MSTNGKKTVKAKKTKAASSEKSVLKRPTTWIMAALLLALLIIYGISIYGLKAVSPNRLEKAELATFSHLAEMYIKDMEFTVGDGQKTIKQTTGYGISDEDGVLFITFDYAPYVADGYNIIPEGDLRHAIIYFQWDNERNTYGHAFSYHDDASYHPDGLYVKLSQ